MGVNNSIHNDPSGKLTDWMAERQYLGRFYQSQGLTKEKKFTNDCGPASLAMVVNMLLFQANLNSQPLDKNAVVEHSNLRFWERLPYWVPSVGGATPPWGMVLAFNRLAEKYKLDWHAERKSHARRAHVIEYLMTGKPVSALKIWKNGGAHWVDLVRYARDKDRLYFLDPNPYLEHLPAEKRLQSQTWPEFEADWSRKSWWSRAFGIHCELIIYSKTI
jgi:hypothetical protein